MISLPGNILDETTALKLKDVDFVFLATDNIASRNVFNALLHQYLIPGAQIGAKVRVDPKTKKVIDIHTASRIVLPYPRKGCLYCNGWIPPGRLQEELLSDAEREAQRYVEDEDVVEPSVITLNVLSASQIVNDFMMMFTKLYEQNLPLSHIVVDVINREVQTTELREVPDCVFCSRNKKSRLAKGDQVGLPCRRKGGN